MSFKVAYATPSAAVAASGTITFSYPAGTTAGDYANFGHYIVADGLQSKFSQDAGTLSVSFGSSDITVTYRGLTSIPAGTRVTANFNVRGLGESAPPSLLGAKRMFYGSYIRMDLGTPATADADAIVETQNLTAAGVYSVLAFNGVFGDPYANAYAIMDVPRNVVAAWTTNAVLTVTGEDEYGDVIIEKSAGGSASFTGKKAFKKITSITTDTNITGLTVGSADVFGLPAFLPATSHILASIEDNVFTYALGYDGDDTGAPLNVVHLLAGTAVAGVQTTPTATTGDVRGTWDPTTAANGSKAFGLLVMLSDPNYRGVDNYDG